MPSRKSKTQYSVQGIKDIVAQVKELSNATNPRKMLEEVVTRFGGEIAVSDSDGDESLHVREKEFTIYISPITSPNRDNFTIAHELGHLILHTDHKDNTTKEVFFGRYGSGRAEAEANRFAAELLMPEDQFKAAAQELDNNEYRLAGRFGVSVAAARVRIDSICHKNSK